MIRRHILPNAVQTAQACSRHIAKLLDEARSNILAVSHSRKVEPQFSTFNSSSRSPQQPVHSPALPAAPHRR